MMRTVAIGLCFGMALYSCAPSQDTSPEVRLAALLERETLLEAAYEDVDAAVLARLLHDDFVLRQLDQDTERSKSEWLAELQSLTDLFPRLDLTVVREETLLADDRATVSGQRTFTWTQGVETGTYPETFTNYWRYDGGEWILYLSEVRAVP